MEIKKYPELTTRQPFYTREESIDLTYYATRRHTEVTPELNIPEHMVAVLAAYPELGYTHINAIEGNVGETIDLMFCVDNEGVYTVYKDIIDEVSALFPSHYVHLGGDKAVTEKN